MKVATGTLTASLSAAVAALTLASAIHPADAIAAGTPAPVVDRHGLPRTIITTDGEADDMNSFIRLLYYANELDIVGLVYSSSVHHWKGDGVRTLKQARQDGLITSFSGETAGSSARSDDARSWRWEPPGWMEERITHDYSVVYPNLIKHDPNYPSPAELWSKVAVGNVDWENDFSVDTEGSNLIRSALLDGDARPLYLEAWGGTNTIARALRSIEAQFRATPEWPTIEKRVLDKAVIAAIGQQDNAYEDYIAKSWPGIKMLDFGSVFGGFTSFGARDAPDASRTYFKAGYWSQLKYGHGPLLERYGLIGDGSYFVGEGNNPGWQPGQAKDLSAYKMFGVLGGFERLDWTGEGDTPAFISLVPTGLRFLDDPSLGGWGGRLQPSARDAAYFIGAQDISPKAQAPSAPYTVIRWMPAIANDFAARAAWGVSGKFSEANHAPRVTPLGPLVVEGTPGKSITLQVRASDPDGDALSASWWIYGESSNASGNPSLRPSQRGTSFSASLAIPVSATPGQRVVVVADITDAGSPALTRYAQFVVTVR